MVQLPLETSKQSEETVPPGDGPAAWDSERDPEFCGQGSTGSDFFFFNADFKKGPGVWRKDNSGDAGRDGDERAGWKDEQEKLRQATSPGFLQNQMVRLRGLTAPLCPGAG